MRFRARAVYFKPQGVPMRLLKTVELNKEEVEALRLKHVKGFSQVECASEMETSQSTFQRILQSAHKKISRGIIEGRAIRIEED